MIRANKVRRRNLEAKKHTANMFLMDPDFSYYEINHLHARIWKPTLIYDEWKQRNTDFADKKLFHRRIDDSHCDFCWVYSLC